MRKKIISNQKYCIYKQTLKLIFFGFWVWVEFGYITKTRYLSHPLFSGKTWYSFTQFYRITNPYSYAFTKKLRKCESGLVTVKIGWIGYRVSVIYPNRTQTRNPKNYGCVCLSTNNFSYLRNGCIKFFVWSKFW